MRSSRGNVPRPAPSLLLPPEAAGSQWRLPPARGRGYRASATGTGSAHVAPRGSSHGELPAAGRRSLVDEAPGPLFLTVDETAVLLRTSCKAIYAMAERGRLPGVVRVGRRLLVRREVLLESLSERRAASPGGSRR
jgi:excisionase family DNA binding protein